jgi:2-phosphoglycerate kinase
MAAERKDVIVEGVHLVPGTFPADTLVGLQRHAAVVQVVLTVEDPEVHRSHFLHRLDSEHGRQPHRYLAAFDRIRRLHDHVRDLALRHAVPTVDAGSLDHAVQEVLGLVVGAVTSESESLAVEAS